VTVRAASGGAEAETQLAQPAAIHHGRAVGAHIELGREVQRQQLRPVRFQDRPGRTACISLDPTAGQKAANSLIRRSVTSMWPGLWVMQSAGREAATTAWGVTPQAQNTGTSPGSITVGSP